MTQTFDEDVVFNKGVVVDGSDDIVHLRVEGASSQTQPLQTWQDDQSNVLARITDDGRLQIGDQGISTPDALIEASKEVPASDLQRGLNTHGQIDIDTSLSESASWSVHELELTGQDSNAVSSVHTTLRARLAYDNNGDASAAELRAGDFEAINQSQVSEPPVGQITGLRAAASNGSGAYLAKAVGVEATVNNDTDGNVTAAAAFEVAPPVNTGTISALYGLRIPPVDFGQMEGTVTNYAAAQLGDNVEMRVLDETPLRNPPEGFIKVYPKLEEDVPKLYAKDSAGVEHNLIGGGGGGDYPMNNVLLGNGTDPFQTVAPSAAGNALRSDGTTWQSSAIQSSDLGTALTSPPAIGTTMPASGTFDPLIVGLGGPHLVNENSGLAVRAWDGNYCDVAAYSFNATGYIQIIRTGSTDDAQMTINAGANAFPSAMFQRGSSNRWSVYVDNGAQSGGDVGGDFWVGRYHDDGSWIDASLTISRKYGKATLSAGLILDSVATLQVKNGAGEGKVLTSDADGNATWQTPTSAGVPTGVVMAWTTDTAPSDWLLCSGQAVSRTTYADLFSVIGTTYGTGDGSTTFNVPDLRGRAPIGVGQGTGLTNRALAASGGEETHTLTIAEMPSHNHSVPYVDYGSNPGLKTYTSTSSTVTGSKGGGSSHNNMQPWLALNFIIKT